MDLISVVAFKILLRLWTINLRFVAHVVEMLELLDRIGSQSSPSHGISGGETNNKVIFPARR